MIGLFVSGELRAHGLGEHQGWNWRLTMVLVLATADFDARLDLATGCHLLLMRLCFQWLSRRYMFTISSQSPLLTLEARDRFMVWKRDRSCSNYGDFRNASIIHEHHVHRQRYLFPYCHLVLVYPSHLQPSLY